MRRRQPRFDFIELISEQEARQALEPFYEIFRGCIEDAVRAVEAMEEKDPEFFHVYPAGARATLVYWQIVDRAETRFKDVEGVSISFNRRFLTVLVADKLEIRFKKLNRHKLSRNYMTQAQKILRFQLRLIGMEEPTRATAGYRLTQDGSVLDYLIVCERGHDVEWDLTLPVISSPIVARPEIETPTTKTPKIRPKKAE